MCNNLSFRRNAKAYFAIISMALMISMFGPLPQAYGGGNDFSVPQSRITSEELSRLFGMSKEEIEKWEPCYRAFREYDRRLWGWRGVINKATKEKKLSTEDFNKLDFSLPDDPGFGDDPENEFFNPQGKYKAIPMPQDLIDELSSVKNTRLIFNVRRWFDTGKNSTVDLFSNLYRTDLVVIIPDFIFACPMEYLGWNESSFTKENIYIAPDNHSIVEDKEDQFAYQITSPDNGKYYLPDGRKYYMSEIAIHRSRK